MFAKRHIGIKEEDLQHMLATIGVDNLEQLINETLPDDIRLKASLGLSDAMSEHKFLAHIQELSLKNKIFGPI